MHKYNSNNIKLSKKLRNNPTKSEMILWKYIRQKFLNGLKFRRQQPIGSYIVDFVCFYPKIIIEVDGGGHNEINQIKYDIKRDIFLQKEGFVVVRIWNNDIINNIDGVITYIMKKIEETTPTPKSEISTLPSREGKIMIQCPAKINLTLKIINKREDGFHNLESIMQTINLFDFLTLSVEQAEKFEIKLSGNNPEIPYDEKNLVYKAILLFIERTNLPPHKIEVYIEKNIPVSAGLAGGSTNAAGTLFGLNEQFKNPLNKAELHELCAKLGSDLNFCLEGGKQMTTGRGEILTPLEFKEFDVSLIKPANLGISAKEAYTKFARKNSDSRTGRENFENDLEWAIIDDYDELKKIKTIYPDSIMSGSGSTYFGIGFDFTADDENYWVKNGLKAISYGIRII